MKSITKSLKQIIIISLLMMIFTFASSFSNKSNKEIHAAESSFKTTPMIATGDEFSLALKENGTVWSWGYNSYGQLGDGTKTTRRQAVQVYNLDRVINITSGYYHSVVLKDDGAVWTWGRNVYGLLGTGISGDKTIPTRINITDVVAIAAGSYHTIALKNDGTVWTWGYNDYGQLGDGSINSKDTPVQVLDLTNIIAITAGSYNTFALKDDGTVWSCGRNNSGQIGDGTGGSNMYKTRPVQANISNVIAINSKSNHTIALKDNGTVWIWGSNSSGQLGNGTSATSSFEPTPTQIDIIDVKEVTTGEANSFVIKNDGTVWAWGNNSSGQLGNGTRSSVTIPKQSNFINISKLSSGTKHTVALRKDGSIWASGDNTNGQLGDGTNTVSSIPVQVLDETVTNYLRLLEPFPAIIAQPSNINVNIGENASFIVDATGYPTPTYQWQIKIDSNWENINDNMIYNGATSSTLNVLDVNLAMNGAQYRCLASNTEGVAISNTATLTVAIVNVNFNVEDLSTITLPNVEFGYVEKPFIITAQNTGNQAVNWPIQLLGTNASSFTLSKTNLIIAPGANNFFSITPKPNLGVGNYTAIVKIEMAPFVFYTFNVAFEVTKSSQVAPSNVEIIETNSTSITLTPNSSYEYSIDNGVNWQASNIFNNLTPSTLYMFLIRKAGTSSFMPSPSVTLASVTSIALKQTANTPSILDYNIAVQSIGHDFIILTSNDALEYSINNGVNWQQSSAFTNLNANTLYTFNIRLKETSTHYASAISLNNISVTTGKILQGAITGNLIATQGSNNFNVNVTGVTNTEDVQYSLDSVNWQDSNTFINLIPGDYVISIRLKGSQTHEAGMISTVNVNVIKIDQAIITNITTLQIGDNYIILSPISGAEYSIDGVNWQDSNSFTGLTKDTEYSFYARYKETATHNVGTTSNVFKFTTTDSTAKLSQSGIPTISVEQIGNDYIVISSVSGAEYSIDNGVTWQDSNVFTNLSEGTQYSFIARLKSSDTLLAGNSSVAITATTNVSVVPEKGLSTGASIAIGAGASTVILASTFSIVWFIIKKKSMSQLFSLFK